MKDVKQIIVQQSYPLLLILNDVAGENILRLVALSHAFLLTKTDKTILSQPEVIQVAQFSVGDASYSLLRKVHCNTISLFATNKNDFR